MNKIYVWRVLSLNGRMVFLYIVPLAAEERDNTRNKNRWLHFLENLFRFKLINPLVKGYVILNSITTIN